MINAKRATALLWTANVLVILAIAALVNPARPTREVTPPHSLPPKTSVDEPMDLNALAGPRPLAVERAEVLLIGIDRIARDPSADTAYLYLVSRKVRVNAYAGEAILDPLTGREAPEVAGWRLARVTSKGAVFSTPLGDRILQVAEIPSTFASVDVRPISIPAPAAAEARGLLEEAADLYVQGWIDAACIRFEEAFELQPSCDVVYDFLKETGEDVMASLMNSKDRRLIRIGYRIFELAKPSGDRIRPAEANA
jgi:hypothetical protein